ncbi:MAG: cytochrome b/b6 domain-containing protein [Bacteroidota bacterium]
MQKKWSAPMRIYHWINSLVITLLLITVVLRKTVLDKHLLNQNIQNFLEENNFEIAKDLTLNLAKQIRSEMWDWHYVFGFILASLIVIRVVLFFTKSGITVIKDGFSFLTKKKKNNYWIQLLYLAVYLAIFIISLTGVLMYFYKNLGWTHDTKELLESIHVSIMNIIIYFIPIHIIGIVLAENEDEKGITSDMINGGNIN